MARKRRWDAYLNLNLRASVLCYPQAFNPFKVSLVSISVPFRRTNAGCWKMVNDTFLEEKVEEKLKKAGDNEAINQSR